MKKTIVIYSIQLFLAFVANAQSNLENGLVGYYPFDGNANNAISNNYNGTVNGATLATNRFGKINSAYSFDGVNDYINITDFGDIVPSKTITVSLWMKDNREQGAFLFMLTPDNNRFAFASYYGGRDYWDFGWTGQSGNAPGRLYYSSTRNNEWHHYVLTSNTEIGSMKIYKDNVLMASKTSPLQLLKPQSKDLRIGCGNNEGFFNGLIDDFRIYNRELTTNEIALLYNESILCDINITKQPIDCSVDGGSSSTFTTIATGANLNYQWQINSDSGFKNINSDCFYSGEDSSVLSISTISKLMDNNQYRCIISNEICKDTTNFATITVKKISTTIYDTLHVSVTDTVQIMKYDTTFVSVTDTLVIEFATGAEQLNMNLIKIYPNPTKDFVNIDFGDFKNLNGYFVKVINELSQIEFMSQITQEQISIDISSLLGKGIYYIQIIDKDSKIVSVRKLLLQ